MDGTLSTGLAQLWAQDGNHQVRRKRVDTRTTFGDPCIRILLAGRSGQFVNRRACTEYDRVQ